MSYETNRTATQQESTPELFELQTGNTYERYTSYRTDVTFQGFTYTAASISRGNISTDVEFGTIKVRVKSIITPTLAQYIANQPTEPTSLTIYRMLTSDATEYVVVFTGQIQSVAFSGNQAEAVCQRKDKYLSKRLPDIVYQSFCNHDVYDDDCGLNSGLWVVSATLTSVSGSTLVSPDFAATGSGYLTNGWIQAGTDMRLVTAHTGDTVTIQIPFDARVYAGITVDAYPGCDGDPST